MPKLIAKPPEETAPGHSKLLLFGPSGVGKTWFGLSFPRPYYFDTEGGAQLPHYRERLKAAKGMIVGPDQGTLDFNILFDQMLALSSQKHEFKTLIIDSITKLYQACLASEQERLGSKDAFGASTKLPKANMRRLMNLASRLDMNIVFIAHETAAWGEVNGQRTEIGKTADVFDKLVYDLDLTLHCQKRGASRIAVPVKSRLLGFPEGQSFPLDFAEFAPRYGKDYIDAEPTQIILATAEQVARIQQLLAAVKLADGEFDKILERGKAEAPAELSTDHADATIKWLEKKIAA